MENEVFLLANNIEEFLAGKYQEFTEIPQNSKLTCFGVRSAQAGEAFKKRKGILDPQFFGEQNPPARVYQKNEEDKAEGKTTNRRQKNVYSVSDVETLKEEAIKNNVGLRALLVSKGREKEYPNLYIFARKNKIEFPKGKRGRQAKEKSDKPTPELLTLVKAVKDSGKTLREWMTENGREKEIPKIYVACRAFGLEVKMGKRGRPKIEK